MHVADRGESHRVLSNHASSPAGRETRPFRTRDGPPAPLAPVLQARDREAGPTFDTLIVPDIPRRKTPAQIDQGNEARYTRRFYRDVLTLLDESRVPVLVGGAFAFTYFTGIQRPTKDFDIFIRREDVERALEVLGTHGFVTELTFPHWLGKAKSDEFLVDIIFGSGNGVAPVDDEWFEHAVPHELVGVPVMLSPAEEMLWSKAFVMERERYDGADVIHLMRARGRALDWDRLVRRFGQNWRVLYFNLVLYGFVYPGAESPAPPAITRELARRLAEEDAAASGPAEVCRGTLISREQYLIDVAEWGLADGRLEPHGPMTADEIATWTAAIEHEEHHHK